MPKLFEKVATTIVSTIISNIQLDEAILICAFRAEREEQGVLARQLKRLASKRRIENGTIRFTSE